VWGRSAEIAGIVIYDTALIDTVNLATAIAGIENGLVASPAQATVLMAAPYNLPVIADLQTNHARSRS
jgi:GxGYxYP_N second domain